MATEKIIILVQFYLVFLSTKRDMQGINMTYPTSEHHKKSKILKYLKYIIIY